MPVRPIFALLSLALTVACSSRPVADDDMAGSDDPTAASMAGTRPEGPGTMYSLCEASDECPPLEFCVFPENEAGYCTAACQAPEDPNNCAAAPGDQDLTCFDIGLADGRQVCALDCGDTDCPVGMRCEEVQSGTTARSICF